MSKILQRAVQIAVMLLIPVFGLVATRQWELGSTPEPVREGWAPDAVELSEQFVVQQPPFQLTVDGVPVTQDNEKANVRHWEFIAKARGAYPENTPQQIGDCVSWGSKHATEGTEGSQIIVGMKPHSFKEIYPPWIYGAGRVWVLKGRIRGDGLTGAAAAEAVKRFGVLHSDFPGLPPYSGTIARQWGNTGPPERYKEEAAKYRIKTTARVTTAEQVRDAIANGYGIIICSDWGAESRSAFRQQDGRWVASRNGSWMHCMTVDGYDGTASQPYYHIKNSWGPTAHPAPIDDSPPGGFWVTRREIQYIVSQGDSWAFSDFDGFPVIDFDPAIFGFSPKPWRRIEEPNPKDRRIASGEKKTTLSP